MVHKWQATFTVNREDTDDLGMGYRVVYGDITFQSKSKTFPSWSIPEPIADVSLLSDPALEGSIELNPGDVFVGEFRDSFGGYPAFWSEELSFSLQGQTEKVYR